MRMHWLTAMAALGLAGCAATYPSLVTVKNGSPTTCLVGGKVLVGEDLVPTSGQRLCFADGIITRLESTDVPLPPNAAVVDVGETTVLPGFVDTHVHVTATDAPPWEMRLPDPEHNLQAWLHAGITTVFDLGGAPEELIALRDQIAAGDLEGPQIFFGHEPITTPNGHPIPAINALLPWPLGGIVAGQVPTLDDASKADAMVEQMHDRGAQYIKIILDALPPSAPRMKPAVLKALIDAAHARGLKAFVHIGTNQDALEAIAAGADHLAHGVYRESISDAVIDACVKNDVTVTFTAAGFENTREMAAGKYQPAESIRRTTDPAILAAVSGEAGAEFAALDVLGEFSKSIVDGKTLRANVSRLHTGGVKVLVGTDSPIAAVFPGGAFTEEVHLMKAAGIPVATLLRRATVDAARLVEPTGPLTFGALAVGARADILVVKGDPLQDLSAWVAIEKMYAGGRDVVREVD